MCALHHMLLASAMVVENGLGQDDKLEDDKTIHDPYRIDYMRAHVQAMSEAIEDGVDLIGYTPWGQAKPLSAIFGISNPA